MPRHRLRLRRRRGAIQRGELDDGNRFGLVNPMSGAAAKYLVSVILLLAGGSLAWGQAGSTGGTLGKTGKSISGEDSPAAPDSRAKRNDKNTPDQASAGTVAGRWRWDADCGAGGHWRGEFDLTDTSRGHFNGSFAATSPHDVGTITNGTVSGGNFSFTRTNPLVTQYWKGRLAAGRMNGTSSGNANCSWQATRK